MPTPPTPDPAPLEAGLDSLAVVFPGQGSQAPGGGRPWVGHPAWAVVDRVEDAIGRPVRPLLLDTGADLSRTEDAQLAVLATSLVAWEAARPYVEGPVAFAGHSLGQVTALIASGAVALEDGARLAAARARATQECTERTPGGLVALLGASAQQAAQAVAEVEHAWVANDNAPGQVVVGGTPSGLDAAVDRAGDLGVRRARRLEVGGAFHTPLMRAAADAFAPEASATTYAAVTSPVVTNHDAAPHWSRRGWADRLRAHLVRPVRWRETVDTLADLGARRVVELGPGTTLSALVRRCRHDLVPTAAATPDEVEALLPTLWGVGAR